MMDNKELPIMHFDCSLVTGVWGEFSSPVNLYGVLLAPNRSPAHDGSACITDILVFYICM